MTIFNRLFRKAPPAAAGAPSAGEQAPSPAPDSPDELARVAGLPDGDELRALAGLAAAPHGAADIPESLRRAARLRLAHLIDEGAIDFDAVRAQSSDLSAVLTVAASCRVGGHLERSLAQIQDPSQIDALIVDCPSSRVRQLAAESVADPVRMRALLKLIRTKDKVVYKILKQKVDALNEAERMAAQNAAEAAAACAAIERHAQREYDVLYVSTFEHVCARWRLLEVKGDTDTQARVDQAIQRCEQVIADQRRLEQARAAERAAQQAAEHAREAAAHEARLAAEAEAALDARRRAEADVVRLAEAAAQAEKAAAREQFFRQIGGLIRKAHEALGDGTTQRAAGLRKAIEERRDGGPELPAHLVRSLEQLDEKLSELKQWKDFVVAPKRIELIEEMESLVGSAEEPQALANRIKSLQQDWKTISKGIVSEDSEDWKRFHQAAQAAYQPCQAYFAAQAKIRDDNLQGRQALVERLAALESREASDHPDWRLLARALREAPQEWRRLFPVEREPGRAVQDQYDALIGRLKARLDVWYERNVSDKRALTARARHLLTQEDGREAVETVKRLQAEWKETEPAPRDQEQALWKEFREACDAVFQKRQQAHVEFAAGLEANKAQATSLCEEVERVAGLTGAELLEAATKLPEFRAAFEALEELPRADARGLRERFESALERCDTGLAQQRERDREAAVENLFAATGRVRAYGLAVAGNAAADDCEAMKRDAEEFIAGVRQWPKGGQACVKAILVRAESARLEDVRANTTALRMLCIRAEILSEIASPPEDEALRREHQVKRLMQGMGQGIAPDDWDAMSLEWTNHCIAAPEAVAGFEARFMLARSKRPVLGAVSAARRPPRDAGPARGPRREWSRDRGR